MALTKIFITDDEFRILKLEKLLTVSIAAFGVYENDKMHFVSLTFHL
jgi:hypothetical protein